MCVCSFHTSDPSSSLHSAILKVRIINIEEHEKRENFYIILEEPKWLKRGISGQFRCVCVRVYAHVCVCVCTCVSERGRGNVSLYNTRITCHVDFYDSISLNMSIIM